MTIKFVADFSNDLLLPTKQFLEDASGMLKVIPLENPSLSAFPDFRRPRVIVLTFKPNKELADFHNLVQEEMHRQGIPKDSREFLPHLTLGRVKKGFKISKEPEEIDDLGFKVSEIALIKSELNPKGSVYSNLGVYKLT